MFLLLLTVFGINTKIVILLGVGEQQKYSPCRIHGSVNILRYSHNSVLASPPELGWGEC